jgi:hypothetical protein
MTRHAARLVGLSLALATPALAQNLVANAEFDTQVDTLVWADFAETTSWDALDVDNSLSSGSALLTESAQGQTGRIEQGITVSAGTPYTLSGCGLIPSGQSAQGYFEIAVVWYADPCTSISTSIGFDSLGLVPGPLDSWECPLIDVVAPPAAQCGRVVLFMRNNAGSGPFSIHFDAVYLPEPTGPYPLMVNLGVLLALAARRRRV